MSDKFDAAFDFVIGSEGGYSNDPHDLSSCGRGLCFSAHDPMKRLIVLPSTFRVLLQSFTCWHAHMVLPIVHLLFIRCPATVVRFVVSVYIYSIKRLLGRTFTHVCDKSFEAVKPAITHTYAAAAVLRIFRIGHAITSPFGVLPSAVLACIASAMSSIQRTYQLNYNTSAASDGTGAQSFPCHDMHSTALTLAAIRKPSLVDVSGGRLYREPAELLTDHFYFSHA